MAVKTVRLRITGRVQGVGYRLWAERVAQRLGVRGWVRNRADGSVEALVTGEEARVSEMIEAARRGPSAAHVGDVLIEDAEEDGAIGFAARPTA